MYARPHIVEISDKRNRESCEKYIRCLSKENEYFFSSDRDDITVEEAIRMIDDHSKYKMTKEDAKWYAPMYAFSEKESQEIVKKVLGRVVKDIKELSSEEIHLLKKEIIKYGRQFQDVMAENFNKKELGIVSGKDLVYVGVVEISRKYEGDDIEVRKGLKKVREKKDGLNIHIHLVQSRRANNAKRSKISPMAKQKEAKSVLGGSIGFDRNNFTNKIEQKFDEMLSYERDLTETYLYKKFKKNPSGYDLGMKKGVSVLTREILEKMKPKDRRRKQYISPAEVRNIINRSSNVSYFFELERKGIVRFVEKIGEDYYFEEIGNEKNSRISVSEKGWKDFKQYIGGGVIKAVQYYNKKDWQGAILELQDMFGGKKGNKLQSVKVCKVEPVNRNYLMNYFRAYNISDEIIKNNVVQISYENPQTGKISTTTGIRNDKGGFQVYNRFSSTFIANDSISVIKGNSDYLIFETLLEYLSFLQYHGVSRVENTVVILHHGNNLPQLEDLLKKEKGITLISTTFESDDFWGAYMDREKQMPVRYLSAKGNKYEDALRLRQLKEEFSREMDRIRKKI